MVLSLFGLTTATRLSNGGVFPFKLNVSGPVRTDPFWIHFLHAQKNVSATRAWGMKKP